MAETVLYHQRKKLSQCTRMLKLFLTTWPVQASNLVPILGLATTIKHQVADLLWFKNPRVMETKNLSLSVLKLLIKTKIKKSLTLKRNEMKKKMLFKLKSRMKVKYNQSHSWLKLVRSKVRTRWLYKHKLLSNQWQWQTQILKSLAQVYQSLLLDSESYLKNLLPWWNPGKSQPR